MVSFYEILWALNLHLWLPIGVLASMLLTIMFVRYPITEHKKQSWTAFFRWMYAILAMLLIGFVFGDAIPNSISVWQGINTKSEFRWVYGSDWYYIGDGVVSKGNIMRLESVMKNHGTSLVYFVAIPKESKKHGFL